MLDSFYMESLRHEKVICRFSAGLAYKRPSSLTQKFKLIEQLLLITLPLSISLYAQLPTQGGNAGETQIPTFGGTQTPTTGDCSDPLSAGASGCTDQNLLGNGQFPGSQTGSTSQGIGSGLHRSPNLNYSDVEQLSPLYTASRPQSDQLAPEPLTEFQKFVASMTGQILPIYGVSLFSKVPSTFAPLDMSPVPLDYIVGPGDELRVRVWGQVNFQTNVRVDRSGEIFLPQIGPVHVAGTQYSQLGGHLRDAIGRVYHNFDLTVDVGQIRSIQVYITGQARRPGVFTVSSLSTLADALFSSGGPTVQGSMRHIQLRRGSEMITDFDLYRLLVNGDRSKDVPLQSGDVVFIPPAGTEVAVTGSVRNSAIYELRAGETLADLLANAGGVNSMAAEARISIERIQEHHNRQAIEVAYDANGLATPLADGDLIRVYSIVPMYQKTVILRGNTANPGRFAWHAGMRISDLIPDKESLITRNYWWKRAQLGLPAQEFEPIPGLDRLSQPPDNRAYPIKVTPPQGMNASNQPGQVGYEQGQLGYQEDQPANQQGQARSQQDQSGNQQGQSGSQQGQDVNQRINGLSAQQRATGSSLAAVQSSSVRSLPRAERTEVKTLAPEIDWDYAVIERLNPETLKMVLIPFDLGRLVQQHDVTQDLVLEAGDVVSIFSEADIRVPLAHQTKTVMLDGEFAHAGVYTVQPGETLRSLVERAGGLTPDAYLFGSELTRESTRVIQQARIDEYVQNLSMGAQRANLALASSAVSSPQDLVSNASAQSSERDLIASLRLIRATGRIVLRFPPDGAGVNNIPALTLEDGDRFVVPPRPAVVNVVGAVYDQNSFVFGKGGRVDTYLQLAGGPNRDADQRHSFVIRADGEVVSHEKEKGLWGNEFNNLRIYPGDTIMVPEKTFRPGVMRGVIDWSQIFSQFALGAAAIQVLK